MTTRDTSPSPSPSPAATASGIGDGLFVAEDDGLARCRWCRATPAYRHYHDHEWGFPVTDDRRLFEKLCLESFQAGLSWLTILNKRAHFRRAFADFHAEAVARFGEADVARLLADAGIVRHRGKIEATINNARRAIELRHACGSLAAHVWRFEPDASARPARAIAGALAAPTASATTAAAALSKDLKQRGWRFVGPTTTYAFMQAMGLVNDHVEGCVAREQALRARRDLRVP